MNEFEVVIFYFCGLECITLFFFLIVGKVRLYCQGYVLMHVAFTLGKRVIHAI
jgi:hypothetical protein